MKITLLLMIVVLTQVSAAVYAQKINLNESNISIEKALSAVKAQSGFQIVYIQPVLENNPQITLHLKNVTVEEALKTILSNQPVEYSIIEKTIVIREKIKQETPSKKPNIQAAMTFINGRIVDEKGLPLPGVNVRIKGTTSGTVTTAAGQFSVGLTDKEKAVLVFSLIGYATQEIPAATVKGPLVIQMKLDISKLDEVQVIAYGTTTKRNQTGAISTIDEKVIGNYPTTNVLDALQGTVPGINISKATGNINGSYKVLVRGQNSVSATSGAGGTGSNPLYIIDGIPYQGGTYDISNTTISKNGAGNDALNFINPLDIESISVLKDADATSIYGSRGANGVILITTKKGKAGATKIDFNVYNGISKVSRMPSLLNAQQYLQMRKEAKKNDNSPIGATDYDINGVWDTTRTTNWAKYYLGGTGHTTNAQGSFSGGGQNVQYLLSGNYRDESSLQLLGGHSQTASIHFNINGSTADNKFSVLFSGGYLYNINKIPQYDLIGNVLSAPDAPPLTNPDGSLNFDNNRITNPLVYKNLINSSPSSNLTSSAVFSYKPINNLEIKATLGYNKQNVNEFLGTPSTAYQPSATSPVLSSRFTYDTKTSWSIEPQINYNQQISKGLLTATVGSSLQKLTYENLPLYVTGYTNDALLGSVAGGTTITANGYQNFATKFSALFGRINYNWDGKYLVDLTGRYDGSSKFGENRQFHFFPAAGLAWIFSEEQLVKNLSFLSFGKIRASYGVTGNDQLSNGYLYLETYSPQNAAVAYQGVPGIVPNHLGNPDISWETTQKANLGLDLQFFKGRVAITADLYQTRTVNLLSNYPLSLVTGFGSLSNNSPALIRNRGLELTLTTNNIRTTDFNWSTTFLFTTQRNKLLSYPGLSNTSLASSLIIGQPVNILKAFRSAGVNSQTGIYQFYDANGNIVATPNAGTDKIVNINVNPDFYGSVSNSFRYKRFTLDFLFRYIKQNGLNAFGQMGAVPPGLLSNNNYPALVLNRWQKPGDVTNIQRYGTNINLLFAQNNAIVSDMAYGDASYIRLQNVALGYTLPQSVLSRLHVSNLRFYFQGENLLTISKYGAIDPESQSASVMPPLKYFTVGMQLSL